MEDFLSCMHDVETANKTNRVGCGMTKLCLKLFYVFFSILVPVDITMFFRQVKLIHCVVEGGQFIVYF